MNSENQTVESLIQRNKVIKRTLKRSITEQVMSSLIAEYNLNEKKIESLGVQKQELTPA